MNLHGIVSPVIGIVNPLQRIKIQISTGVVTTPAGKRIPSYARPIYVMGSVQSLQYNDIMQMSGINVQGTRRKIYLSSKVDGLVRATNKGGDLITLPDGTIWIVAMVAESWPEWTSVIVTLQNNA